MKSTTFSALDIYMNRVFKSLMLLIPLVAVSAAVTLTTLTLLGYYPTVPFFVMELFDVSCLLYLCIGVYFVLNCEDANGDLKPNVTFFGKICIAVLEAVQWNFISYMIPSRDFWAYAVFFVALVVLFLDHKYVAVIVTEISVSIAVSWLIKGEDLLPERDVYFVPNLVLRIVFLVLSFVCLWCIAFWVQKQLVSELEKMADYDALTMLKNRRCLQNDFDALLEDAKKGNGAITVILSDLDDFKKINDTYGHACGDRVLCQVADIISRNVGEDGFVYRLGGEEILTLFYGETAQAQALAERIRSDVEQSVVRFDEKNIFVTMTVGVATCQGRLSSLEDVIKCADTNLYYGKNHGKNQVVS